MIKQKFKKHPEYYLALSVSLITFAIYLFSLRNDFVDWDDDLNVVNNLHIRSLDAAFFKWAFFNISGVDYWRPLSFLSHALDYAIWGLDPLGHHLTNNVLHAINTFLVVLLVVRLLEAGGKFTNNKISPNPSFPKRGPALTPPLEKGDGGGFSDKKILITAGITGLLFGLHPINVESVAWVSERKNLLYAFFYLTGLWAYLSYANSINSSSPGYLKTGWRSRGRYCLTLLFFTLALMSKPMAVTFPVVLLILDWYPFKRLNTIKAFRSALIEKLPFIALSIALAILTLKAQKAVGAMYLTEVVPLSIRLLIASKSLIIYLWKIILPFELLPFYPYLQPAEVYTPSSYASSVFIVIISAAAVHIMKKQRIWLAVWSYYVITLLPVLGLIQVGQQTMADRFTYLPSLGPFLVLGLGAAWVSGKVYGGQKQSAALKVAAASICFCILVLAMVLTVRQIRIWKDSFVLWSFVIEKKPGRVPIAHNNLGLAYKYKGQLDMAIEQFRTALSLEPNHAGTHNNLGNAYFSKGLFDIAIEQYQIAVSILPKYSLAHNNLGLAFLYKGWIDQAIEQFRIAVRLNPDNANFHYNLGLAYKNKGQWDMARTEFELVLKNSPDHNKARQILDSISKSDN